MTSKRKSNQTCICMLMTQLCTERSISSMIITFPSKILTLSELTTTWLMNFNICKCAILPITKERDTRFFNYTIFGNTLERVDDHEYLGVSVSRDLSWEKHCYKITKKASKTLGLLRRTLSPYSKEVKSRVHQALVRPQHEYTAEAWNHYYITTADRIEHIQCAAVRLVHDDYRHTTSVNNLTNILGWDHLNTRRLVSQITMFHKIHYHLVNIHSTHTAYFTSYFYWQT